MEEQFYNFIEDDTITLSELTEQLQYSDTNATQRWLKENKIPTEKRGRTIVIYKWEIDFAHKRIAAIRLKERFPLKWGQIFEAGCDDKDMVEAIFAIYPPTSRKPIATDRTTITKDYLK